MLLSSANVVLAVWICRFDPDTLREALALRSPQQDGDAEEDARDASQDVRDAEARRRRILLHGKAEPRARYNEGKRFAEQRDAHLRDGRLAAVRVASSSASQLAPESGSSEGAPSLTSWQEKVVRLRVNELIEQNGSP